MCDLASGIAIGSTLLGAGLQTRAQGKAADRAFQAQSQEIARQTQGLARQVAARREQQGLQLQANQAQQDIADRSGQTFRQRVNSDLGNPDQQLEEIEQRRGQKLDDVVRGANAASEAGQARQVGSDIKGRVSEDFTQRGRSAAAENQARAERLAGQLATIAAFRQQPVDRADRITQIGLALQPFTRERQSRAASGRLRVQGAGITDPVPQSPVTVVDPSSGLGDVLVGLGQAVPFINFGGGGGPTTSSGGGGQPGAILGPVRTQTRGS